MSLEQKTFVWCGVTSWSISLLSPNPHIGEKRRRRIPPDHQCGDDFGLYTLVYKIIYYILSYLKTRSRPIGEARQNAALLNFKISAYILVILRQTVAELCASMPTGAPWRTSTQYSVAFCSRPEAATKSYPADVRSRLSTISFFFYNFMILAVTFLEKFDSAVGGGRLFFELR